MYAKQTVTMATERCLAAKIKHQRTLGLYKEPSPVTLQRSKKQQKQKQHLALETNLHSSSSL